MNELLLLFFYVCEKQSRYRLIFQWLLWNISLVSRSKISCRWLASVTAHDGMCLFLSSVSDGVLERSLRKSPQHYHSQMKGSSVKRQDRCSPCHHTIASFMNHR